MLNSEILMQGLTIMLVGMGVVFSFLVILVFATMLVSSVVKWLNKVCPVQNEETKKIKAKSSDDSEIALAIAAAFAKN